MLRLRVPRPRLVECEPWYPHMYSLLREAQGIVCTVLPHSLTDSRHHEDFRVAGRLAIYGAGWLAIYGASRLAIYGGKVGHIWC